MIKFCLDQWEKNKYKLKTTFESEDFAKRFHDCEYEDLVVLVVDKILNPGIDFDWDCWDSTRITMVDNGDYQGTLLFLIPRNTYQPSEDDYLMTYVGYGSCCGCDTLLQIRDVEGDYDSELLNEVQIKDLMTLCKDLVTNMIRPYNAGGWRYNPDFDTVEY